MLEHLLCREGNTQLLLHIYLLLKLEISEKLTNFVAKENLPKIT